MRKFEEFTTKSNDKDTVFRVYEPAIADYKEAAKARNEAFVEALQSKAPLRAQVNTLLRSRGQWDDEREEQYNKYSKDLLEKEKQLKMGGIKLSKAREVALAMKETRLKLRELLADRSTLDNMTAEGQADNAHFNALVTSCLVYNDEKGEEQKYFKSLDDYLISGAGEVAIQAAEKLAGMLYTIGDQAEKGLPENQFLLKYKFINDKLHLVNKDGQLVDSEGRLVDENGRFISADGKFVDKFGNEINEQGDYVVDSKPFLNDDGTEIIEEIKSDIEIKTDSEVISEEKPKRGRPKSEPKSEVVNTEVS